jgi:hypothetical protein
MQAQEDNRERAGRELSERLVGMLSAAGHAASNGVDDRRLMTFRGEP